MIQPLGSRVVIKEIKKEDKQDNSFFDPSKGKDKTLDEAEVIAIGSGELEDGKQHTFVLKVGDKVLFSKYTTENACIDGESYYITEEEKILAKI